MAKSKRHFIKGRMNKSLDERLIPNGEYVDAMNVRLGSTEESEVGSVESTKGNEVLTTINLGVFGATEYNLSDNAKCIGAFEDGANETIYWFIHDSNQPSVSTGKADLIVSYNVGTQSTEYHIVSFKNENDPTNTTLNFNPQYLITEVNMVGDLLFFTDNYNPPRKINVNKNYPYPTSLSANDGFPSQDIEVIVKPPSQAPIVTGVKTNESNPYLEERFICFGYRYQYDDNEYSATSVFSNPVFSPNIFNLSVETNLNEGMTNTFTTVNVEFNSGESRVKNIEILVKESDSPQIRVVEKINKTKFNYLDSTVYNYTFTDNKIFTVLSSGEILRLYDNVPLKAKTQTLMGNRLMYGNYVDGYDLTRNGDGVNIDYFTELEERTISTTLLNPETPINKTYSLFGNVTSKGTFKVDLEDINNDLVSGSTLSFSFNVSHNIFNGNPTPKPTQTNENIAMGFSFTLSKDYDSIEELIESNQFQSAIGLSSEIETVANNFCSGTSFTDNFNCLLKNDLSDINGIPYYKYKSGITGTDQPITVTVENNTTIVISILAMSYTSDTSSPSASNTIYEYYDITAAEAAFQKIAVPESLHSNRGYQVGIVYMDEFNRATTALTSQDNTVKIPSENSVSQNKIKVTIPTTQLAPSFAKRYKFVIKPDGEKYETIYSRFYYTDTSDGHTYFLLEGENIQKVEEGDVLIVKKDSLDALNRLVKATVLEKKSQSENFLTGVESPAGVYMKMLANNFSTSKTNGTDILPGMQSAEENSGGQRVSLQYKGFSTEDDSGNFTQQNIPAGTRININFDFYRNRRPFGCEYRSYKLVREFISPVEYPDIIAWWNGQNIGDIIDSGERTPSSVNNEYISGNLTTQSQINDFIDGASFTTNRYQWARDATTDEIKFIMTGMQSCSGSGGDAKIKATFEIFRSGSVIAFETEPSESLPDVWYEGQDTYPIDTSTGYHLDGGNFADAQDQDQSSSQPAILHLRFANCFTFGNGVESFTIRDSIKGKSMQLGNRVTTISEQDYKEVHRDSDITYSGIYNDETNLNRLNEFNLGLANFKSLEDSFGALNKIYARETDVLALQEDKISYVLSGKNLLSDAAGGDVLTSVPEVLGKQVARIEEYGISHNTESFVAYGYDKFFADAKRGALIQLKGASGSSEQLIVISDAGMRSWFRDLFKDNFNTQKLGAYDPYMNEYVLSNNNIELPTTEKCIPCGQKQSFILKSNAVSSFCVETQSGIGDVSIQFEVPTSAPVDIEVNWDGSTVINQAISGLGSVTFNKNKRNVNKYTVTVTASNGTADFNLTTKCVLGNPLSVVDIVLTSPQDTFSSIHHNWRYTDGTIYVGSPEVPVSFEYSSDYLKRSYYQVFDGIQGEGSIPIKGQDLIMRAIKYSTDSYNISSGDKFLMLATNTLYNNTTTQINALLAAIKSGGASNRFTPSVSGNTTIANFTVPTGSYDYLYLVWDLRANPSKFLCSDTVLQDVCCECACAQTNVKYRIQNGGTETVSISYTDTNGATQSTSLSSGKNTIDICSQTTPVVTPATSGIQIQIVECDCT
ncbi:MAG: putative structural protein [Prokaryotic dsDNA virus sp.]|nr:MAG: putative structural protein [Prokaryotic dsDNA virus sp.]|tara:strand:+ start:4833 stop:9473 length:4641 start_codon:yes stop_codon:yes gene_type:complete